VNIPDPLPLRNIEVPREVTAVEGCTCGGMTLHRAQTIYDPPGSGCALWSVPDDERIAAVEAAEDREAAWGTALNRRLRESDLAAPIDDRIRRPN
jgi:hypothetical protein